ncbi:MAG: queuosine precursor transporter [Deltaproteobacteria bacterium]|nr:queuosine precursor transporter [Deltaproteobacteria bacterium]MBW2110311.1 queuosine precursor transporter [Deltaproteobacteria bacterium]
MNEGLQYRRKAPRYSLWFMVVVAVFITSLMSANIISVKLVGFLGLVLPAGVIIFPVSYIAGDLLTEVYGYSQARKVIWLGFFCNLLMVMAIYLGQIIPPVPFWDGQTAYERILGYAPRLLGASFAAYLVGEFLNAYVMAKMKIATRGRWLWTRTITSTLVGQGVDSLVFITLAFAGTMSTGVLLYAVVTQWLFKSAYEAAATPITYRAVGFLKGREGLDVYDHHTSFNPILIGRRTP